MEALSTPSRPNNLPTLAGILLLLTFVATLVYLYLPAAPSYPDSLQENRMQMEKNSGRNGKHANQKAREAAEQKVEEIKAELERILKKPGVKTPEDKTLIQKLQDQLAHWRRKSKWSGEHHSQKGKGN